MDSLNRGDVGGGGPHRSFVAHSGVVGRRMANETILVPVSSGVGDLDSIYTLSEVGSRIWEMLATPVSFGRLVEVICAEYDVSPEVASRDVAEFLDRLVSRKLARQEARDDA